MIIEVTQYSYSKSITYSYSLVIRFVFDDKTYSFNYTNFEMSTEETLKHIIYLKSFFKDGKYEISEYNTDYQFAQNMLFPRMWSSHHKNYYESWTGRIKNTVPSQDGRSRVTMPTQLNNLTFFINYQVVLTKRNHAAKEGVK